MPTEIKFSLETEDRDGALLRCQEHNLRLEREWRANLVGTPPDELSHLQIVALAGELYAEMIAANRDEQGRAIDWGQSLGETDRRKRFYIGRLGTHLRMTFGGEAQAFLRKRGILLVGDRLETFVRAYVAAKQNTMRELLRNAQGDYRPNPEAARYPKFAPPNSVRKFETLWAEFCDARMISSATHKKWKPYFEQLTAAVSMSGQAEVATVALQALRRVQPNISLAWIANQLPWNLHADREHYLEAFCRAGLDQASLTW
ncbi:hypothetical protein AB7008_46880 [Bradyrhizobium sp. 521_C7_N1_3]